MEKRRREQLRRQKQQDKKLRKDQRAVEKQTRENEGPGEKDADLAEMVAGPQPGQIISFPD